MRHTSIIEAEIDKLGRPYRVFSSQSGNVASIEAQKAWDAANPGGRELSQRLHDELHAAWRQIAQIDAERKAAERAERHGVGKRSLDAARRPTETEALERTRRWWRADPPLWVLVLHGLVGNGKTVAATWAYVEATRKGMSAEVRKAASIVRISSFEGSKEFEHLKQVGLLVIDDLGAESLTDYGRGLLGELLDARYEAARLTVITANLTREQMVERLGQRLIDRLAQGGERVELKGKSLRHETPKPPQASLDLGKAPA